MKILLLNQGRSGVTVLIRETRARSLGALSGHCRSATQMQGWI